MCERSWRYYRNVWCTQNMPSLPARIGRLVCTIFLFFPALRHPLIHASKLSQPQRKPKALVQTAIPQYSVWTRSQIFNHSLSSTGKRDWSFCVSQKIDSKVPYRSSVWSREKESFGKKFFRVIWWLNLFPFIKMIEKFRRPFLPPFSNQCGL